MIFAQYSWVVALILLKSYMTRSESYKTVWMKEPDEKLTESKLSTPEPIETTLRFVWFLTNSIW